MGSMPTIAIDVEDIGKVQGKAMELPTMPGTRSSRTTTIRTSSGPSLRDTSHRGHGAKENRKVEGKVPDQRNQRRRAGGRLHSLHHRQVFQRFLWLLLDSHGCRRHRTYKCLHRRLQQKPKRLLPRYHRSTSR